MRGFGHGRRSPAAGTATGRRGVYECRGAAATLTRERRWTYASAGRSRRRVAAACMVGRRAARRRLGPRPGPATPPGRHAGHRQPALDRQLPWLNDSEPIETRVSQVMAQMTLADEIDLVEGHGSSEPYVFYEPAIAEPVHPAARRGGRPQRRRRRPDRRHPAARRRHPRGDVLQQPGAPVRRRRRLRGVGQGRRGRPRPDDQPRPRPSVGPLVRGLQRGPLPERRLSAPPRSTGCRPRASSTSSSTTTTTTRRPTATRRRTTRS